jgi:hypothetical protein
VSRKILGTQRASVAIDEGELEFLREKVEDTTSSVRRRPRWRRKRGRKSMSKKSLFAGLLLAAVLAGANASGAFAGEVKGPSGNTERTAGPANANSICVFSGLNDNPTSTDPADPGGVSQSYGQENKLGLQDPHVFNPGDACPLVDRLVESVAATDQEKNS